MRKTTLLLAVAMATGCKTNDSGLLEDRGQQDVKPSEELSKLDGVIIAESRKELLKLAVDYVAYKSQIDHDLDIPHRIKDVHNYRVIPGGTPPAALLGIGIAVMANGIYKSAQIFRGKEKFTSMIGFEMGASSVYGSMILVSVLPPSTFDSLQSVHESFDAESKAKQGIKEYIDKGEYRKQIKDELQFITAEYAAAFRWNQKQKNLFEEALVQNVYNQLVENKFSTKGVQIPVFKLIAELGISNGRLAAAKKLFLEIDKISKSSKAELAKTTEVSSVKEDLFNTLVQVQSSLERLGSSSKFSHDDRSAMASTLSDLEAKIKYLNQLETLQN